MPIVISSKNDGFRRCGVSHGKEPRTYPDDRFTADELRMLRADPMLSVSVLKTPETNKKQTNR